MKTEELITSLCDKIDHILSALIPRGQNCALLEFPNYANAGDSAIWLAEKKWLHKNDNAVVYACDKDTYVKEHLKTKIGSDGIILLQAGGNFGDIWGNFQHFHEQIIQDFPDNKIIQLPQSIFFKDADNLARSKKIINSHNNLTILCRDQQSFDFAQKEFKVQSIFCPDIVFYLGAIKRPSPPTFDILWLARTDKETRNELTPSVMNGIKRTDWLEEEQTPLISQYNLLTQQVRLNPDKSAELYYTFLNTCDALATERFQRGCGLLSQGKVVVTDRLHGYVMCLLMGIPHIVLDNVYGKVKGVYDAWTKENDLSIWADSPKKAVTDVLQGDAFITILKKHGLYDDAFALRLSELSNSVQNNQWTTAEDEANMQWAQKLDSIGKEIAAFIPNEEKFILVDDDLVNSNLGITQSRLLAFSDQEGIYWGAPASNEDAIAGLEAKRKIYDVNFLLFAWPSFWWLDHYAVFHEYLKKKFRCVAKTDCLILFDMRQTFA